MFTLPVVVLCPEDRPVVAGREYSELGLRADFVESIQHMAVTIETDKEMEALARYLCFGFSDRPQDTVHVVTGISFRPDAKLVTIRIHDTNQDHNDPAPQHWVLSLEDQVYARPLPSFTDLLRCMPLR